MTKLLFITSLERSGSTVLDLNLGRHSKLVSFGEVARVLKPHGGGIDTVLDRPCSCGEKVKDCSYWSPIISRVAKDETISLEKRYQFFLEQFESFYGPDMVPVDSTKYLSALTELKKLDDLDLRVVFTAKDVRGWICSSNLAKKRKQEMPYSKVFTSEIKEFWKAYIRLNILRKVPLWLPVEWYLRNKRIITFLNTNEFNTFKTSYEKLVLSGGIEFGSIFNFLDLEEEKMDGPSKSHVVRGNRMAFGDSGYDLRYDSKWVKDYYSSAVVSVLPFVFSFNKKIVYDD